MTPPSPSIRAWAERLLAMEAATPSPSEAPAYVAVRVFEKLRDTVTVVVGADGFAALQRRALAMARREVPALQVVKLTVEGQLEGIEEADERGEAASALTAQFLYLLITFIGESLARRLIRDAFPDMAGNASEASKEPQ